MKKLIMLMICAVEVAFGTADADAQGLGGLLKKGKEALEKISSATSTANSSDSDSKEKSLSNVATLAFDNGMEIANPMAPYMDVTPIGLYGLSTSENYGNVYLVLRVLMKEPVNKASFGGSVNNQKMIAVDAAGKVYNTDSNGTFEFDTPEGIPVNVIINQPALMFTGVKKEMTVMPMVKFGILIDAARHDNVTLKNVPIFWDENPE